MRRAAVPRRRSRWTSKVRRTALRLSLLTAGVAILVAAPAAAANTKPATNPKLATKHSSGTSKHTKTKVPPARWSDPFRLAPPTSSDLQPPVLVVSASGQLAVGSGTTNEDNPSLASAELITGTAAGRVGRRSTISGSQQVLASAYIGTRLVVLTGTSPAGNSLACCSSVAAASTTATSSKLGSARSLVKGLAGTTSGQLVPLSDGLLAVIDNQGGLWVARAGTNGRFGSARRLSGLAAQPAVVAASQLASGGSIVAWTTPSAWAAEPSSQTIHVASAGPGGVPGPGHVELTLPAGVSVDQLALAAHRDAATLAFTENFSDAAGQFHSEAYVADVGSGRAALTEISPSTVLAGPVSLSAAAGGHQVLAWQACVQATGACTAQAALRPHGYGWGPVQTLGPVDPTDFPVTGESATGQGLVGWVTGGDVAARVAGTAATRFGATHLVSRAGTDANLALAFGPGEYAVAAWTQGIEPQQLEGARFTS
jgi:hypothetical protein